MIVIICANYKKNPSRTVDATERTRFSKSRPNDLEDIDQGQRSSHATHPLMLLIICTKYGKNPSWTVDATGRTRKGNRQTDGQTDRVNPIYPPNFVARGLTRGTYPCLDNTPRKSTCSASNCLPTFISTLKKGGNSWANLILYLSSLWFTLKFKYSFLMTQFGTPNESFYNGTSLWIQCYW